jgi:hypothetical protein
MPYRVALGVAVPVGVAHLIRRSARAVSRSGLSRALTDEVHRVHPPVPRRRLGRAGAVGGLFMYFERKGWL